VNVRLEVGQVTEQVQVSAIAELVQTSTSGNIGNVLNEKTIRDMPIIGTRGRSPLQLILLQPGVVTGPSSGAEVHVHGARDRAFNYTLDGLDNNEASQGGGTQDSANPTRTNPDSIQEFRLITSNPTAENGRNSGAQVQIMTRSGSNDFHGSGFWFYRTPRLNANEWENNLNSLGKRQFVQNIYGGSIGGRLSRTRPSSSTTSSVWSRMRLALATALCTRLRRGRATGDSSRVVATALLVRRTPPSIHRAMFSPAGQSAHTTSSPAILRGWVWTRR
jgi:hypothetical protein